MKKLSILLLLLFICNKSFAQSDEKVANVTVPDNIQKCCMAPQFSFATPGRYTVVFNGDNTLTLSQPITITADAARKILSVTAELNYFEFVPGSEDCLTCNKNSATFGNFSKGTFSSITALGSGTHNLASNFSTPRPNGSFPASLTITLPPLVKCCDGVVRWCIRYIVLLDDCTVCTKVVCYERKKSGDEKSQTTNSN